MTGYNDADVLTVAQVAELLQVERHTVAKMIKAGRIPVVRLSERVVRVIRSELMAALADRGL